jgi:hypothetical protein
MKRRDKLKKNGLKPKRTSEIDKDFEGNTPAEKSDPDALADKRNTTLVGANLPFNAIFMGSANRAKGQAGGTVLVGAHLPKRYSRTLRILAADTERTNKSLIKEALDNLFAAKGVRLNES